ncbi:MAG: HAMP domain-containing protein [Actinobacteria bacterium]|nr:HAMP domain-containing protein [Actinomycetota bacterium]
MSLRMRVAMLTALAVALVEIAIVASIYVFATYRLSAQEEQDLRGRASVLAGVVASTGELPARPAQELERPPYLPRVITSDGRVIVSRSALDVPITSAARAVAAGERASALETLRIGNDDFMVLSVTAGADRALQVAHSLVAVQQVLQQLLVAAIAFGALGLVTAPLAGAAVASGALFPLRRLSRVAESITRTGDVTQRVGGGGNDELATFARSFDLMLDRLETMVKQLEEARRAQRQLIGDASHELRAPLATLRANVELLSLGSTAPVGDRETLLADTLAGIEDLTALVAQLIDLAREDQRVHERVAVELDRVVLEEIDRMQRRYAGVTFAADVDRTTVIGDVEALTRAIANLLDNAGKWTRAGGTVRVRLREGVLEVRDDGPGIDPADLPHVFDRFYRGSRAAGVPGSGLGLAIVAQVMASHGGRVSVRSGGGGAVFTASFAPPADP